METKHTSGPWYEASMGNDCQGLVVDEQTGANVAVVYDKAHAALMSAAPEMLDTLDAFIWAVDAGGRITKGNSAYKMAQAAIRKARGTE